MRITEVKNRTPALINCLLEVWENSVRATHLFLSDSEIRNIKEYVPQALREVAHLLIAEDEAGRPLYVYLLEGIIGNAVHRPGGKREGAGKEPDPIRN